MYIKNRRLTEHEYMILKQALFGQTYSDIATMFKIPTSKVSSIVSKILTEFYGVKTKIQKARKLEQRYEIIHSIVSNKHVKFVKLRSLNDIMYGHIVHCRIEWFLHDSVEVTLWNCGIDKAPTVVEDCSFSMYGDLEIPHFGTFKILTQPAVAVHKDFSTDYPHWLDSGANIEYILPNSTTIHKGLLNVHDCENETPHFQIITTDNTTIPFSFDILWRNVDVTECVECGSPFKDKWSLHRHLKYCEQ